MECQVLSYSPCANNKILGHYEQKLNQEVLSQMKGNAFSWSGWR